MREDGSDKNGLLSLQADRFSVSESSSRDRITVDALTRRIISQEACTVLSLTSICHKKSEVKCRRFRSRQYSSTCLILSVSQDPANIWIPILTIWLAPEDSFLVIGAGVVGLTNALELRARYPSAKITIAAKFLPGDSAPDYTSAWGGANWFPAARDNGRNEDWEAITYRKFKEVSSSRPESGIQPMNIRWHYDAPIDEVGIKTPATGKLWFEDLVGGLQKIEEKDLPSGTAFGFEMASFVIDVQKYLPW